MQKAFLYLEDGSLIKVNSFGASGSICAEMVFNTSITGYQEVLTDPSYTEQIVVFTMPEIGNVGVNPLDSESKNSFAKAIIVRNYQDRVSSFRSKSTLSDFLKQNNIIGISGVDTRYLTGLIRENGNLRAVISTELKSKKELKKFLDSSFKIEDINCVKLVSTRKKYEFNLGEFDYGTYSYKKAKKGTKNLAVIDFGVKKSILNDLCISGFNVFVYPYNTQADEVLKDYKDKKIDAVFLSNGPGDPLVLQNESKQVKKIFDADIPIFAICLGQQILHIANGFSTFKLAFGHHGSNHPVVDVKNKNVFITSQNHNYNISEDIKDVAEVTHRSLFDNTIEGVKYKNKKVFSVQFHPESNPGPNDTKYLFKQFYSLV